jgi:Domain of unknown function (DUF5666)
VKSLVATFVTAILGAASAAGYATTNNTNVKEQAAPLLLVGPVESVNAKHTLAVVLGQKVLIGTSDRVTVGDTVAVYGESLGDGSLKATKVVSEGLYVPGATSIFISGTVQQVQPSIGRATVSGLPVDLTSLMAQGAVTPAVGSTLEITGTQPVNNGLFVASGISGGGKVASGISGGGLSAAGISGGGLSAAGISGGGKVASGISGGGLSAAGISGGGLSAAGISGGGKVASGISGGGL